MLETLLYIQHTFNSLHIYCRLVERGCDKDKALLICNFYEKTVFRFIFNPILKTSIFLYKKVKGCPNIFEGPCKRKK
jgi:hypothetical protein